MSFNQQPPLSVAPAPRPFIGLPCLRWMKAYTRQQFGNDALAAVIVTIMLIPQSLAYALLAGLPPEVGLYASILPLVGYAIFGSSTALAVGPVAVISLMTAAAAGQAAASGGPDHISAAVLLAGLSGLILMAMAVLRLGFIANFLSHPVISGFITASGIIIATSQVGPLLGIPTHGYALPELASSIAVGIGEANLATALVGLTSIAFLLWLRLDLKRRLAGCGVPAPAADIIVRTGPVLLIAAAIGASFALDLGGKGVALMGEVPAKLPTLALPSIDLASLKLLLVPAFIISLVGFVESVSVAQTLGAKRRERIDPNQELVALGVANMAASVSGGYPVTGGFARSIVNHEAKAATPAAGAFTALGIAIASLLFTPYLERLPKAVLAATIIVAVSTLVDLSIVRRAYQYSKADFAAVAVTLAMTFILGAEMGISAGVAASILVFLYRSSRPHAAIVGQVPGTEHYRNIKRHAVDTVPGILAIRVDESLYFANARYLEDLVYFEASKQSDLRHVVLMCSAVNQIDLSALESLEAINRSLNDLGIVFHLSEVKGPVMDCLARSGFPAQMTGRVFLTHHQAINQLRCQSMPIVPTRAVAP